MLFAAPISRSVNRPMRHECVGCYFISDHRLVQISQFLLFSQRTHTIFHFTGATLLQELLLNKLYIFQYQTYKCSEVKRESCHSNSGFSAYYLSKYKVNRLVSSLSSGTALEDVGKNEDSRLHFILPKATNGESPENCTFQ